MLPSFGTLDVGLLDSARLSVLRLRIRNPRTFLWTLTGRVRDKNSTRMLHLGTVPYGTVARHHTIERLQRHAPETGYQCSTQGRS